MPDMNVTDALEKLYQDIMFGNPVSFEPRVMIMSWAEFQTRFGVDGEYLNKDYKVVNVEGCAQVMKK